MQSFQFKPPRSDKRLPSSLELLYELPEKAKQALSEEGFDDMVRAGGGKLLDLNAGGPQQSFALG